MQSPTHRNRLLSLVLITVTVVLGLASRRFGRDLPGFVAAYAGDTLWALMVFFLLGCCWPRWTTLRIAVLTLAFSFVVEFGQLFHPAWLEAIRHTLPGRLVLGTTFVWSDLPCYTVGVLLGVAFELVQGLIRNRVSGIGYRVSGTK